jgi:hypothetical protein
MEIIHQSVSYGIATFLPLEEIKMKEGFMGNFPPGIPSTFRIYSYESLLHPPPCGKEPRQT